MNRLTGKGDAGVSQPRKPVRGILKPSSNSNMAGPRVHESNAQAQTGYFETTGNRSGTTSASAELSKSSSCSTPTSRGESLTMNPSSTTNVDDDASLGFTGLAEGDGISVSKMAEGANPNLHVHGDKGVSNVQIQNIDDVSNLFWVPHNSLEEIDAFVKDLELGKHELWTIMSKENSNVITNIVCNKWDALLKARPKDTRPTTPPSDTIVQYVDINSKSTSYAGAAGASTKEQPKVNTNFRPLVADPVFKGVNISIPRKVVEKAGLEAVLKNGPWMIRNTPIILKKWSIVFEEDGSSLIATFIAKPIMLDSYTSSMCNDSCGRSSFARCLIEVNSEADLVDVVTIGVPSLTGDDFTKETIRVVSPPIVSTSNVVAPTVEKSNDGFQTVGKKKKRKGKSKSTNGGQFAGRSVKQIVRYKPKETSSAPKKGATNVSNPSKSSSMLKTIETSQKKDNFTTSNSFSALNDEEEDDEVENVYDESANLFKTGGSSSFTAAVG
ncbi:hypothetical protein Tco_0828558 [Tanacetum coccineum]